MITNKIKNNKLVYNYSRHKRYIKNETYVTFLPTGDLYEIISKNIMFNQFQGDSIFGAASNIYIRLYKNTKIFKCIPLRGVFSKSKIQFSSLGVSFNYKDTDVNAIVKFSLINDKLWNWNINATSNYKFDILYGQDLGVADKNIILNNELYVSQYLDHKIFNTTNNGNIIASRYNQGNQKPFIMQGFIGAKAIRYSTDAMQFFGKSYKKENRIEALYKDLENRNYQYELAYVALQSEKFESQCNFNIFCYINTSHPNVANKAENLNIITKLLYDFNFDNIKLDHLTYPLKPKSEFLSVFSSPEYSKKELDNKFDSKNLIEIQNNKIQSFFIDNYIHVVLQNKELCVERPHGHIITSRISETEIPQNIISTTNYIYGQFNAQIVCGNTNLNRFTSANRGLLNVIKNTGQRIFIKIAGKYTMLNLPAAYILGLNFATWEYKINNDILSITVFTSYSTPEIILKIKSLNNIKYDFIILNHLVCGENLNKEISLKLDDNKLIFKSNDWAINNFYKDNVFSLMLDTNNYTISDDRIFFEDDITNNGTILTLDVKQQSDLTMKICPSLNSEIVTNKKLDKDIEFKNCLKLYKIFNGNFHLQHSSIKSKILNETAFWYTHNALIHFASPHGLEQSGGAAWGTRDICQGPMEFFLATSHYSICKNILLNVFSHHNMEINEWPQWFMFDKYPFMANECHGDIIFWPLKALSDYIFKSGDYDILNESIYNNTQNEKKVSKTVLELVKLSIDVIKKRFVSNTGLITYAGGDWDDTLQPANEKDKENLISSWTICLAYQSLCSLGNVLQKIDTNLTREINDITKLIHNSFNKYLIKNNVIAGFGVIDNKKIKLILHPNDKVCSINYRLLPMTRSIISKIVDNKQAESNFITIKNNLKHPDGIRLMDKPTKYTGGNSKMFLRAEQAANVGREISLQYVHAHIRYIEAMTILGKNKEAFNNLFVVNPILISKAIKNALPRQSNTYFSSSEGNFYDRYEFEKDFDKLKNQTIDVKCGWRIYSSGPGIYINQLISNILGFRKNYKGLTLDPVITNEFNGLKFTTKQENITYIIEYNIITNIENGIKQIKINGKNIEFERENNPYRIGGIFINNLILNDNINKNKKNYIEIMI